MSIYQVTKWSCMVDTLNEKTDRLVDHLDSL